MFAALMFALSDYELAYRIGYICGYLVLPTLAILVIFFMLRFRAFRRAVLTVVAVLFVSGLALVLLGGRSRQMFTLPASESPPRADVDLALVGETPEARTEAMLAWNRRTLEGAYDKVGKKDLRWDKHARLALEAAARNFSLMTDPDASLDRVHAATQQAIKAGCDDPMIRYLHVRSFKPTMTPAADKLELNYAPAAVAMAASGYPPFRRIAALHKAAQQKLRRKNAPAEADAANLFLTAALDLLPASAAEDERTRDLEHNWYELARDGIAGYRQLGAEPTAAMARVDAVLARHSGLNITRLLVRGDFYITYAWEARGSGLANGVTPEKWALFQQRLAQARTNLEAAWAAAPGNGQAAELMMTVELADSRGREAMELWFDRARKADPNGMQAYRMKLEWLHPKWHGTFDEMLAFARVCRDTGGGRNGIGLLVAGAHHYVADTLKGDAAKDAYFRRADVAGDIRKVYTDYLGQHPDNLRVRSEYAYYCFVCGQHAEANRQFLLLGANLTGSGRLSEQLLKRTRDMALASVRAS